MFTLDQARAFVAVAEELHFGRAAERLHMTQPPLSRQVQKLEKALDVGLLIRGSRGVTLTAAGTAFLDECRQLLDRADRAPQRARLIDAGQEGLLRLGYTAASSFSILGGLLSALKERAPGVSIELREMVTAQQMEALRTGAIDMGLARPPFPDDDAVSSPLLQEALVVALHHEHPLARRGQPVTAAEMRREPLIMHSTEHARYFRDLVVGLLDVREDQVTHTVSQVLTMMTLVAAGHGCALVPDSAARLGLPKVTLLPLVESPSDVVQLHAMWSRGSTNPALKVVLPIVKLMRPNR